MVGEREQDPDQPFHGGCLVSTCRSGHHSLTQLPGARHEIRINLFDKCILATEPTNPPPVRTPNRSLAPVGQQQGSLSPSSPSITRAAARRFSSCEGVERSSPDVGRQPGLLRRACSTSGAGTGTATSPCGN